MKGLDFEIEVKIALLKKSMTQSMLAKELGITNSYLTDILKGNRKALKHREKINKILELEMEVN